MVLIQIMLIYEKNLTASIVFILNGVERLSFNFPKILLFTIFETVTYIRLLIRIDCCTAKTLRINTVFSIIL